MSEKLPVRIEERRSLQAGGGIGAGSIIDQALSNLSAEQRQALMGKAADEALRLEAKMREQNLDYVVGRKAVEDHVQTFGEVDKRGRLTRHSVVSDVKTGAGNMRIESKSGAACFVATAAFRDAQHPTVDYLREYRSTVLVRSAGGRAFVGWYWKNGPKLAWLVDRSRLAQLVSRTALRGLVHLIRVFR
jgi:hypothetical protein